MGSQAGACGAWGQQAGGGELAPPREEGRGEAASDLRPAAFREHTSGEVNVWLLQMKGQGCFGVLCEKWMRTPEHTFESEEERFEKNECTGESDLT